MPCQANNIRSHSDSRIRELLDRCPFLIDKVNLSEGAHYIMTEVVIAIQDATLSEDETACVFAHFNEMARGDVETQNLLIVSALEVLTDTPESIERTRKGLDGGPARFLFEQEVKRWTS